MGDFVFGSKETRRIEDIIRPTLIEFFKDKNYTLTSEDLEDLMQESLIKVYMKYDKYDESISRKAWFQRIATRCALDFMNKENKRRGMYRYVQTNVDKDGYADSEVHRKSAPESSNTDYQTLENELNEILDIGIESLGTIAPLVRLRAQGHTYEEIQEITGRTYGTLRTQVSQGLNKLKKFYCDNYAA